ncbi:AraC family transcriptional regulator [Lederbergia sp. NSJ-179]|uniref:helix-turn-helix domain-containing protein n=1 Tax=Lederbergia sp. NSJ-179 TaxID=2931402 RepID=UPI001FD327FF|nr:AraC family transcriptional regulator [Lederbergia sp. NSJ-179]MCJ7839410.1 AraC family transcriptional regulator [Lederbergia sp. NSJ-179]
MDINFSYKKPEDPLHISHRKRDTKDAMPEYHSHVDHYEVYYLMNGKRKYFIKDKTYHVNPGNLVFIHKGVLHRTFHVDDYEHERLLINFTDQFFAGEKESYASLLQSVFKQTLIIELNRHEQQEFEHILFTMIREMQIADEGFELYLKTLLLQLLISSVRFLNRNSAEVQEFTGSVYHKMTDIIHYINKHYSSSNLTLDSVAGQFFISSYYLSRIFKKATGFTYSEYLNHVRIQEAQRLLRESNMKVIDIAGKVGFNSLTHFGRVFKNSTRYTPSAYRKLHRI